MFSDSKRYRKGYVKNGIEKVRSGQEVNRKNRGEGCNKGNSDGSKTFAETRDSSSVIVKF